MQTILNYFNEILKIIEKETGICINDSHATYCKNFFEKRCCELNLPEEKYLQLITQNRNELNYAIDNITINETYFFREEKQFEFLEKKIFPTFRGKKIVIWSAACSTGEEPYSLATLALHCGVEPIIYATDIDSKAIESLKEGKYFFNSFRTDGAEYSKLLKPYLSELDSVSMHPIFSVSETLKKYVISGTNNLIDTESNLNPAVPLDETVDILFIRNVFIYFEQKKRIEILKKLSSKVKNNGYIFFSMSEIAGIDVTNFELDLCKQKVGEVYFLRKGQFNLKQSNENTQKLTEESHLMASSLLEKAERQNKILQQKKNTKTIYSKAITNASESPQLAFDKLSHYLNSDDIAGAERYISSYIPGLNQSYLLYYFRGCIYKVADNKEQALEFFEKSIAAKPDFWPGAIQCGLLHGDIDKSRAYKSFLTAATILESYIANKQSTYDYLFEDFNASYFYNISTSYIKKELSQ